MYYRLRMAFSAGNMYNCVLNSLRSSQIYQLSNHALPPKPLDICHDKYLGGRPCLPVPALGSSTSVPFSSGILALSAESLRMVYPLCPSTASVGNAYALNANQAFSSFRVAIL